MVGHPEAGSRRGSGVHHLAIFGFDLPGHLDNSVDGMEAWRSCVPVDEVPPAVNVQRRRKADSMQDESGRDGMRKRWQSKSADHRKKMSRPIRTDAQPARHTTSWGGCPQKPCGFWSPTLSVVGIGSSYHWRTPQAQGRVC